MESKTKRTRIIVGVIAALVILVVIGMVAFSNFPSQKIKKQLDLGQKYLTELKYEQAVAAFKEALDIDPNNEDAIAGITKTYGEWSEDLISKEKYASAVKRLDEAMDLLPDNQDFVDMQADAYIAWIDSRLSEGDYSKAQELAEEGYSKLGDSGLKSKLDEIQAKMEEDEAAEADINEPAEQETEVVSENNQEKIIDTSDLANFIGADEQDILKAFPDAKKQSDGEGGVYYMVEGETADFAIAGPFFYLDNNGKVYEVGYEGNKYSVNRVYRGMNAQEVITGLENEGWVIQSLYFTNGTGTCNATLTKGNLEYFLDTDQFDAPYQFAKSDLTGNVTRMFLRRE